MSILASLSPGANPSPEASLDNGKLKAIFHLPDPTNGYYRGSRFDWSGVIKSLTYQDHSYFGVWFEKYDPLLHDAITGPVEEFVSGTEALGYSEAKPGGNFVRIGIGALCKQDNAPFERFGRYTLADAGKWKISQKRDRIVFQHDLNDSSSGYGYRYTKTIRLVPNEPTLVIEHSLKNTGGKAIATETYNHNFFMIDGEPTGPNMSVKFRFPAAPDRDIAPNAAMESSALNYRNELQKGQTVFAEMKGLRDDVKDYDLRIENSKTRAGVHITGDRPVSKLVYWSIRTVLCPEPYIRMNIAPGKDFKWSIRYDFYTF